MSIFAEKVAVITGGASGIGFETCRELLKQNIKVLYIQKQFIYTNNDNLFFRV